MTPDVKTPFPMTPPINHQTKETTMGPPMRKTTEDFNKTPPAMTQNGTTMAPSQNNTTEDFNKTSSTMKHQNESMTMAPPQSNTTKDFNKTSSTMKHQNGSMTMAPPQSNTTKDFNKTPPTVKHQTGNTTMAPPQSNTTEDFNKTPPTVSVFNSTIPSTHHPSSSNFTTSPTGQQGANSTNINFTNESSSTAKPMTPEVANVTSTLGIGNVTTPSKTDVTTNTPSPPTTCDDPLGLSDGLITDDKIMASSAAPGQDKGNVRLDCCKDDFGASWCPDDSDPYPWIEITLPQPKFVSAILFQHPARGMMPHLPENYVTSVTVNYVPGGALDKNHFINFHKLECPLVLPSLYVVRGGLEDTRARTYLTG
ncbi:mucin-2-like [Gigantopelta aegis]|uniref:mucin-2-like n=1 Tax=Gigantopelta aegis TaxID=1735272 RepID=UPI001B888313|nr:mucin-2-like [Gigantopelta aegis]